MFQNSNFRVFGGANPNRNLGMMNPGMMNPCMMNPGMMNPCMMNTRMMNPCMMNPGMMNPCMMNPGMMNPCMMPFMKMNKPPLTEGQKRNLRYMGYVMGKKMAQERKKTMEAQTPKNNININYQPQIAKGNITIKFKKGGVVVTSIKMDAESMVAELIDYYFRKTGTNGGTFNFQGNILSPNNAQTLSETGLRNGSEIVVS